MQSQSSQPHLSATQAKDRHFMQLSQSLVRLSRAMAQTANLCEQMKGNLDAMKTLSANHAAQFMTVAEELNPDPDEHEKSEDE